MKASFSIATTPWYRGWRNSFPWIAPPSLDPYLILLCIKQSVIKYHFLARHEIEPWFPGPLVNTLNITPKGSVSPSGSWHKILPLLPLFCQKLQRKWNRNSCTYIYIYIYMGGRSRVSVMICSIGWTNQLLFLLTHKILSLSFSLSLYIYIYIYTCVCVCVCACFSIRQRMRFQNTSVISM